MNAAPTGPETPMTQLNKKAGRTLFALHSRAVHFRWATGCLLSVFILVAPDAGRAQQAASVARRERDAMGRTAQIPPQVLAVIHRLYGLRLAWWMAKQSGAPVLLLSKELPSHANIVAGRVLNDGQTVIARLPNARAEQLALPPLSGGSAMRASDFLVVRPDGTAFHATLVGVDDETGLSLLRTNEPVFTVPQTRRQTRFATRAPSLPPKGGSPDHLSAARRTLDLENKAMQKATAEQEANLQPAPSTQLIFTADSPSQSTKNGRDERSAPLRRLAESRSDDENVAALVDLLAPTQVQSDARRLRVLFGSAKGTLSEVERPGVEEIIVRAEHLPPAFAGAMALSADGRWLGIVGQIEQKQARVIPRWRVEKIASELLVKHAAPDAKVETSRAHHRLTRLRNVPQEQATTAASKPEDERRADALGLQGIVFEQTIAKQLGFAERGLLVLDVASDKAADRAGLRVGDYIETLDGAPLTLQDWTAKVLRQTEAEVRLGIRRGAERIELTLRKNAPR